MTDKDNYGFDKADMDSLSLDQSLNDLPAGEVEQGQTKIKMDAERLEGLGKAGRADFLIEEVKEKKNNAGLILGVSGVALTLVVMLGGYFFVAPMVLGRGAPTNEFQAPPNEVEVSGGGFSFSEPKNTGVSSDAESFSDFGIDEPSTFTGHADLPSESGSESVAFSNVEAERNNDIVPITVEPDLPDEVHPYSDDLENDGDVVIRAEISEEEQMYDNILAEASTIDVPHEAIKIDRNVVNMELQIKRISRAELDIAETRKSLGDMSKVIGSIQEQTSKIAKAIENNTEKNQQISNEIKQLSAKVEGQIELQKADIAALKENIKKRAEASVEVAKVKEPQAQAVVAQEVAPKPVPVSVPPAVQKPVTLPAPAARPVMVKAPVPKPATAQRASCASSNVSENWRVKGVTPSSAYVVRVQDGQGVYLKEGVSLPGFGTVKSFNEIDRSVCTSSGIVRR